MKGRKSEKEEDLSKLQSPGLQGFLDFEEELERSYSKQRKKHIQGLLKDIEIPREKYILLSLILTSIGSILMLSLDFSTFWLKGSISSWSEYSIGLIFGVIVGAIFALIKIDYEEKRLTLTQILLAVGSINIILQINFLRNSGSEFIVLSFAVTGFVLIVLLFTFLTLFLDYSSILERGRVLAFIFVETIVAVLIISIINQVGIEAFTPLLYITLTFPILTIFYINIKKKSVEKPHLKVPVKEEKKHINQRLILYLFFIFAFSFTIGLASPVYEMEMISEEMIRTPSHKENFDLLKVILLLIFFSTVITFIVGYVFDFFGRLVTISSIIFLISFSSFLDLIMPADSYMHEIFIVSLIVAVIMTITLLVGDVTKSKNYGKVLTIALIVFASSINFGQTVKYYIPIWITDPNQGNLILLGLQYLSSVVCLVLLVNTKETLPLKEKLWHESLMHLYVIHKSGVLLYDYDFSKEEGKISSDLVSGGIVGLTAILQEITKGKERLRTIDHGDKKLMFKYSPQRDVIFVLVIGEDLIVLRDKLDHFILDFIEEYQEKVDRLAGVIVSEWTGVSELVDRYFTRKYFEFIYSRA